MYTVKFITHCHCPCKLIDVSTKKHYSNIVVNDILHTNICVNFIDSVLKITYYDFMVTIRFFPIFSLTGCQVSVYSHYFSISITHKFILIPTIFKQTGLRPHQLKKVVTIGHWSIQAGCVYFSHHTRNCLNDSTVNIIKWRSTSHKQFHYEP